MSLIATLAQDFRANSPGFDAKEFRMTQMGITNAYINQGNAADSIISPELRQKAMSSAGRNVHIPVIDFQDVTVRSDRPIVIPTYSNNSALVTVQWSTLSFGFPMRTGEHYNNDIDRQRDFNKKFQAMLVKFAKTLENIGAASLNANKTLVVNGQTAGTTVGGHTLAAGVVSETVADLKDAYIYADLPPMMGQNDFPDMSLDIIGNQGVHAILRRQEGFGEANNENKRIQYMNNNFQFSNGIVDATGKHATGYAVGSGCLGTLSRLEPDALLRTKLKNGTEWDNIILPGLNIPCGTYEYTGAVDISGEGAHVAHLTRTGQIMMDFSFDIAYITAYNSDSANLPGGIIKFDIQKS